MTPEDEVALARLVQMMREELGDSIIFRSFCKFHTTHPHVLKLMKTFTQQAAQRHEHYGIAAIWERMRWELAIDGGEEEEGFKLSNNHRAYYARLLELIFPELAKRRFFRNRKLGPKGTQHLAPDED